MNDGRRLFVTNGDCAEEAIAAAGLEGELLSWLDVLHEGPVPAGLDRAALREVRATFIAAADRGDAAAVESRLRARDERLDAAGGEIVLWFESDLSDQLQLMQVLDALSPSHDIALVLVDEHPFRGVSELGPAELRAAFERRRPVGDEQQRWARAAWAAFRSADPAGLLGFAFAQDAPVPAIAGALRRHLQQFPAAGTGLSRTERALLEGAAAGPRTRVELFGHQQAREQQPFMGDTWAWRYLDELAEAGLVGREGELLAATTLGRDVLAGRVDRIAVAPIDRWLGGVHLTGARVWRWDEQAEALRAS
jgi:hypothetical protein